ncbi:MAG: hypothetical protein HC774_00360 [Sphingomonadales bacterium]|nr:hypothetical protein [Sphingomonadales bacterium]
MTPVSVRAEGEEMPGVRDAVDFIAELRQTADLSRLPVGRDVVVGAELDLQPMLHSPAACGNKRVELRRICHWPIPHQILGGKNPRCRADEPLRQINGQAQKINRRT